MYFKKLEIFGFKSFADKTVMNFGPGVTAVVGPNGCGKSNVFDAIRWVLGEQSVKELRGSAMEDVIFNGTAKKPSLGFAEVSLTFSNEARMLPVDYNEVTVTRRLFRSGESEYLLNKVPVRLKDILELFMGTGIGAEAYSLVQQGKVDLVVSAKPEERRIIIDEASGITKYKAKRREALNRLRDTESNLLRINDITTEVKRQISSLERQANKARRFKEEFEKLKSLEVQFSQSELRAFAQQRDRIAREVEALQNKERGLAGEMREFSERLEHETSLAEELDDKIAELTADDIKIDGQIDLNNRQIDFNLERVENIFVNVRRMTEQKGQLKERCQTQQEKLAELGRSLATIDDVIAGKLAALEDKERALQDILRGVEAAKAQIRQEEEQIMGISSRQVEVRNGLTESMKEMQGALARKRRLEMENAKVLREKEDVDQRLAEISAKLKATALHLEDLRGEFGAKRQTLQELVSQLAAVEQTIDETEKKRLFLKSQKEFIEKLRVQYQDIPDPVVTGRLITDSRPLEHHTGIIGKVKEVLTVEGQRLGDLQQYFTDPARPLFEVVCETKFIELDPLQISVKIEELSQIIVSHEAVRDDLRGQVREQESLVHALELELQEQEKARSIYEAQRNNVLGETSKLSDELDLVRLETEEVEASLVNLQRSEQELTAQLEDLSEQLGASQVRIQDYQKIVSDNAQHRESTTIAIAQLQSEVAAEEDRKRNHADNVKIFTEAMETSRREIERLETDESELDGKRQQYEDEVVRLRDKIAELKEQKQSLRAGLAGYEQQKNEVVTRMNSVRTNITGFTSDIEEIKNHIHKAQFQGQELQYKEKEIKDRLLQTYKIDYDAYLAEHPPAAAGEGENAQPPADAQELRAVIDRLRKRCDAFGSVNLVAIEEFEELKERFEFLTKQQSDLISAKHSLHQTIAKINRQTRQMFMDTFTRVSEEFRIYFRMLFGGGEAELILLDPENVLESGIDIVARPPGKKLQNISLLSGGEKTLTAIGLIFGVFKVNPSPFCVLDEIDAALDETNVGRFSYLLKDFAKIAQFIVITHNKKTIASAKVMYGVTMQETGVSKIVSVKFGEQETRPVDMEPVEVGA